MCIPIHICMYTDIHVHMHIRGLALSSLFSFEFWEKKNKKREIGGQQRSGEDLIKTTVKVKREVVEERGTWKETEKGEVALPTTSPSFTHAHIRCIHHRDANHAHIYIYIYCFLFFRTTLIDFFFLFSSVFTSNAVTWRCSIIRLCR